MNTCPVNDGEPDDNSDFKIDPIPDDIDGDDETEGEEGDE